MRARLLLKPMHRGQLPAFCCRHARVDGLQRLSGRLALPQAGTPSPSCRRPGANPRSWTEISMGTRAHTTPIAPARRLSSAPRSALRAALRVTGRRSWRSHTTRWPSPPGHPQQLHPQELDKPDCTDKQKSRRSRSALPEWTTESERRCAVCRCPTRAQARAPRSAMMMSTSAAVAIAQTQRCACP